MYCTKIALAAVCVVAVTGHGCNNCQTPKCGPNEVPVDGNPRYDLFCRPLYTPSLVVKELRKCVCKPHFVRNSWGECVDLKSCGRCKSRLQKDWHTCSSSCPVTGNKPIRLFCRTMCTPGCDCPPGWVVDPGNWKNCIKAAEYPPICPPNSRFEPCVSTCEPVCGFTPPRPCFTHCHRGACVCNKGFAAFVLNGAMICVHQEKCLWYLRTASFSMLNRTAFGGGASTNGGANNLGGFVTTSDGTVSRGRSERVLSGDVTHSVGTASRDNSGIGLIHTEINPEATALGSASERGNMGTGLGVLPSAAAGAGIVRSGLGGSTLVSPSGATGRVNMGAPGALPVLSAGLSAVRLNGESTVTDNYAGMRAINAALGAAGTHPGVGIEAGALRSGSRTVGTAGLLDGTGRAEIRGHLLNSLPSAPIRHGSVGRGTGRALTAGSAGLEGIMAGVGGTSAYTSFSSEAGGASAGIRSPGTHRASRINSGASSLGFGRDVALNALLSAAERMRAIRGSLITTPASASGELPSTSGIPGNIAARPSGARAISPHSLGTGRLPVNLEAPRGHIVHTERRVANISRDATGTVRLLSSGTESGGIGAATVGVPAAFPGDSTMVATDRGSVRNAIIFGPGTTRGGMGGTSAGPHLSAELGGARGSLGAAGLHGSASTGYETVNLGEGRVGTTSPLSLSAPGFSHTGTSAAGHLTSTSVGIFRDATGGSSRLSGVSTSPAGISAGASAPGSSPRFSAGIEGVGLGVGATRSNSRDFARPVTISTGGSLPSAIGTSGAAIRTGTENSGVNVPGLVHSYPSRTSNNVVNGVGVVISGRPGLTGIRGSHGLGGTAGTEEALTSVSRGSGGPGIVFTGDSFGVSSGGANNLSFATEGHEFVRGASTGSEVESSVRSTDSAIGNNFMAADRNPASNLRLHGSSGSPYNSGIGPAGFRESSGMGSSHNVAAHRGTSASTNARAEHVSGALVTSWPHETSTLTWTGVNANSVGRLGAGGQELPSATTSSGNGLGLHSSGTTREVAFSNLGTTTSTNSEGANTNGTAPHAEEVVPGYVVGQSFPNTAGYAGSAFGVNPYLPGYMYSHGGKAYANTHVIVNLANAPTSGAVHSNPVIHTNFRRSETLLSENMDFGDNQPRLEAATATTNTSP